MMIVNTACDACGGQGEKIKDFCTNCKGTGITITKASEQVNIPRGIDNNANLVVKGKGNNGGDVVFEIRVKSNPKYRRDGADVYS
jgi:molecular chaperone DnaJ